jgi:hypothetical protein
MQVLWSVCGLYHWTRQQVAPTIKSFGPKSGPAGTVVTITGTNLFGASSVTFNRVAATINQGPRKRADGRGAQWGDQRQDRGDDARWSRNQQKGFKVTA